MADEPEDVLELDQELGDEELDQHKDTEGEAGEADEGEDDQSDHDVIRFSDDAEPAPGSEGESSVIRDLRAKYRDAQREIAELRKGAQPQRIEIGEKPTLESCEYDEERFETELDAWKDRKAKAAQADQATETKRKADAEAWAKRADLYEADKRRIRVSNYAEAEETVFAVLPAETQALLMMTGKPAALIYALSKNPGRLDELARKNLAEAAMMIGKLEDRVTMERRKLPEPDRGLTGSTVNAGSADKELARLEREAARTNDRTKLIAYKRSLKAKAA